MQANHTIKTILGLLLTTGLVAAQTQPKGEAIRPYKPGDQYVYRINATMEGTNPQGEKLNIPMTGTRTITVLSQKYKSPKGEMLLQRKQVNEREITFQGQTRKETITEISLVSYAPDGTERLHGIIDKDKTEWVQGDTGHALSRPGRIYVGLTFNTGDVKVGNQTRSANLKVTRKEKVTVPTGTYDAYVLEGTISDSRAGKSQATMWVVPAVGTVKTVHKSEQGAIKILMTTELAKVKLQKEPVKPAQPKKTLAKPTKNKPKK